MSRMDLEKFIILLLFLNASPENSYCLYFSQPAKLDKHPDQPQHQPADHNKRAAAGVGGSDLGDRPGQPGDDRRRAQERAGCGDHKLLETDGKPAQH